MDKARVFLLYIHHAARLCEVSGFPFKASPELYNAGNDARVVLPILQL